MSAFLGPIHYWLYHKIELQEELITDILEQAVQKGWGRAGAEPLEAVYGRRQLLPLEEAIDHGNIHGWLQKEIGITEASYGAVVTELLGENPGLIEELLKLAYQFGEKHSLEKGVAPEEAYKALEDSLLDGMPCDRVNQLTERTGESVSWQQTQCVHQDYWEEAEGDIQVYYALRAQIIRGMLAGSGLSFYTLEDGEYAIRKE